MFIVHRSLSLIFSQVSDYGINVDSIAVSKDGSENLEELAQATGGSLFFFRTDTPSNGLSEAFYEIGKRAASTCVCAKIKPIL